MGITLNSVIETAKAEIGYKEGNNNYNKYAAYIDKNFPDFYNGRKQNVAWCDVFNDYLFLVNGTEDEALYALCQPRKSCGAGCKFSAQYYKSQGRWGKTPQKGAQIFFGKEGNEQHTGIVISVSATKITTVEGNSNNEVRKRVYAIGDVNIAGFGYPRYDSNNTTVTRKGFPGTFPTLPARGYFQKGDKGVNVKRMQEFLKWYDNNFLPRYGADGDFGSETRSAVLAFQQRENLKQDGLFGKHSLQVAKNIRK